MSSLIEMSLEDIIKKKKKENPRVKGAAGGGTPVTPKGKNKRNPPPKRAPIIDARNKIISRKRHQILDAREKLAELAKQKDARMKLEALRMKRALSQSHIQGKTRGNAQGRNFLQTRGKIIRNQPRKEIIFGDPSRLVVSQPLTHARQQTKQQLNTRKFTESRSVASRSFEKTNRHSRLKPILRTVENDIEIIDDPMEVEDEFVPPKTMMNRKANLQLRIIAHNNDVREDRPTVSHRLSTPEKEKSPPRPPSILKKRPMAALRTEKTSEKTEKPVEYRIIVSNLRNTVTGGDIEELFGDVGNMIESRLVRPGTAEVIYKSVEDAQRAVELYHNRQLDGQPMNCLLVNPRSATAPAQPRNGSKPALYSTNSNVEPDISTFHKVLFNNF